MRFGVMIPHFGPAAQPGMVQTVARDAEALGLDTIWAGDHVIVPSHERYITNYVYEALAVMATAAAVTERIRVGVAVLVIPYRDPVVTAKAVATLDQMSSGRIVLGAGVGWMADEFAALGRNVHDRGALTDEFLDCMHTLWTTDPSSFEGRWVRFDEMRQRPKPAQDPLPVWIGGGSDVAIRRAARRGTGWLPTDPGLEPFRAGVVRYRAACEAAGVAVGTVCLRTTMGGDRPGGVDGEPRVAFSGTPDEIAADVRAYREAGMDEVLFAPTVRTVEQQHASMRLIAEHVRPLVGP